MTAFLVAALCTGVMYWISRDLPEREIYPDDQDEFGKMCAGIDEEKK